MVRFLKLKAVRRPRQAGRRWGRMPLQPRLVLVLAVIGLPGLIVPSAVLLLVLLAAALGLTFGLRSLKGVRRLNGIPLEPLDSFGDGIRTGLVAATLACSATCPLLALAALAVDPGRALQTGWVGWLLFAGLWGAGGAGWVVGRVIGGRGVHRGLRRRRLRWRARRKARLRRRRAG